ncbi:MAG: hypothetical protein HYY85_09765, partial [Deltaproteobacteria bacterium]|nr:hypothetical protein [Deltaproteobacteria bacterium]
MKEVAAESFVAEVKGKDIAALGSHRAVKWVTLDAPMVPTGGVDSSKLATLYDLAIGAPALWSPASGSE